MSRSDLLRAGRTACAAACITLALAVHAAPVRAADVLATIVPLLEQGDFGRARQIAAASGDPLVSDLVLWFATKGPSAFDFETFARLIERRPDWPEQARLQRQAEQAIDGGVPSARLLEFFDRYPPRTGAGRTALLSAMERQGRQPPVELIRKTWVEDDRAPGAETAFLASYAALLREEDHVARLDRLLWDGRGDAARRMASKVSDGRARLAEARILLQQRAPGVDAAIAAVPASLRDDPGLMYDRLKWRRAKGLEAGVNEILLQQPDESAQPRAWWVERGRAARAAIDAGDMRLAYRLASGHRTESGAPFADAEWLAGWLALRFLGQPQVALAHFERLDAAVATPISKSRAAYWAGRAALAAGRTSVGGGWFQAAAGYPTTYYGQLAAAEAGLSLEQAILTAASATEAARGRLEDHDLAGLTQRLCSVGAVREVTPFVRRLGELAGESDSELAVVFALSRSCGRPDLVVSVAKAAVFHRGGEQIETFPVLDLAGLSPVVRSSPAEAGLVLAVARQESQFDPLAVSRAGARGLMQLMPATARGASGRLGLTFSLDGLTADPEYNLALGSYYLRQQLARFDGSVPLAAAAYNAGPGRVSEWIRHFGDPRGKSVHTLVDWIELIPFAETRNYVQRVVEGQRVYETLLQGGRGRVVPLYGVRAGGLSLATADDGS